MLASIGIKLPKEGALKPALFNRILASVEGTEHQAFINEVVLRSQAQAEYSAENYGHFGLNLRRYAHFTSPIRRYADLIVHRALIRALKLGTDGLPANTSLDELAEIGARISVAERRAMAAERETVDRLIAHHLADRIGATFEGRISGVTRAGLFIKLAETGADGFVPAATIGADYYRYDEKRHAMIGDRTGETYRLGDRVEVKLVEAAPVAGALRFELVSEGAGQAAAASRRRPACRPDAEPPHDATPQVQARAGAAALKERHGTRRTSHQSHGHRRPRGDPARRPRPLPGLRGGPRCSAGFSRSGTLAPPAAPSCITTAPTTCRPISSSSSSPTSSAGASLPPRPGSRTCRSGFTSRSGRRSPSPCASCCCSR